MLFAELLPAVPLLVVVCVALSWGRPRALVGRAALLAAVFGDFLVVFGAVVAGVVLMAIAALLATAIIVGERIAVERDRRR